MTGSIAAAIRRALEEPAARAGLIALIIMTAFALVGPLVLPDPSAIPDLLAGAMPPSWAHLLGTDHLNRDLLARIASGARISLSVAALAVILSLTIGVLVGTIAGLWGGAVDSILMRIVDAALAIPRLFFLLLLLIVWEQIPVPALIAVIGLTGWFPTSRLVRGETLRLKYQEFVEAGIALGGGRFHAMFRHLLPNVMGVVLVTATLAVGEVILLEAGLSFLGVGVRPPTPSWGALLQDGRARFDTAYWTLLFPGLAILITVTAVNLVSDALRAAFDPRSA
jgi:ABC-type dipeptide/oligopeptide/nickel transport system permease subunit